LPASGMSMPASSRASRRRARWNRVSFSWVAPRAYF
jgi:hypothetical protein